MSNEVSKTKHKLARTGSKQTLRGVVGDDVDDLDIFGYEVIYTTGEFTVDRDALVEKAATIGIPEWMLPAETMPHNAFSYAIDDLLEGRNEVKWEGQRVEFVLSSNDSQYSYSMDARVFFPPEMTSDTDGKWVQQQLGVIKYVNPDGGDARIEFVDRIDPDESLAPLWGVDFEGDEYGPSDDILTDSMGDYESRAQAIKRGSFRARMQALFAKHMDTHRGKDINNMTYYLVDQWTDSVKLRDACYFVPANHTFTDPDGDERPVVDLIDKFSALYDWLNANADKPTYAQRTEMSTVEIMDTDRQRKMVERKVDNRLEDMAASITETVLDKLEDDEKVAAQVADEVSDTLQNLRAVASEYDDLLEGGKGVDLKVNNAVGRATQAALADLSEDKAELVEEVLNEADPAVAEA